MANEMSMNSKKYVSSQYTYEWTIDDFICSEMNPVILKSESFFPDKGKKIECYLKAYVKVDLNDQPNDYLSIFLFVKSAHENPINTVCKFKIMDRNYDIKFFGNTMKTFEKNDLFVRTGLSNYISMKDLMEKKFSYLPNNRLTIHCTIRFETGNIKVNQILDDSDTYCPVIDSFTEFNQLFEDDSLTDFDLRSGDHKIRGHKEIFEIKSIGFQDYFRIRNINTVRYVDVGYNFGPKVLLEFKRYVYVGDIFDLEEVAHDLMLLGRKYKMQDLVDICEEKLCDILCIENACQFLILADDYELPMLKKKAIKYIILYEEQILNTREFLKYIKPNTHLIEEISAAMGYKYIDKKRSFKMID